MIFAIFCKDKPGKLALRQETRPAHVRHLKSLGDRLKGAGPTLDASGDPNGSLLLIDVADQAEAEAFASADPYAQKGLFQNVSISHWNWILANPYADS